MTERKADKASDWRLDDQKLSTDERAFVARVLAALQAHRGKSNAINARKLAHDIGHKNDRMVRRAILLLIERGHPIASSTDKNGGGYFLAETKEEAQHYLNALASRARENYARHRFFAIASRAVFGIENTQLKLEM